MPYELPNCEIPRISFHQNHSELMHQLERFGIIAFIVSSRSFRSCNLVGSQHTEDVLLAVMGLFDSTKTPGDVNQEMPDVLLGLLGGIHWNSRWLLCLTR